MKKTIIIVIISLFITGSFAQEIITGLSENPVIREYIKNKPAADQRSSKIEVWEPILLPFFDDFKDYTVYPDTSQWLDNEAFINTDYGRFSTNRGVATLDIINAQGLIYSEASVFPFIADHLTSRPIRLDSIFDPVPAAITTSDSLYFSFYYQPQGRAFWPPQEQDSLILEFGTYGTDSVYSHMDSILVSLSDYINPGEMVFPGDFLISPCDPGLEMLVTDTLYYDDQVMIPCDSVYNPSIEWDRIWSSPGMHIDTFYKYKGVYAQQVIIPILDSAKYYKSGFFFRFFNYGSLALDADWKTNCDEWNIDYVYLNIGRSVSDTFYRDIGFVERSSSMLKRYEMMPYDQYLKNPTNVLRDSFQLYITNLDNNTYNTTFKYRVTNDDGSYLKEYDGGVCNLASFPETHEYQSDATCPQHAKPPWKFLFPLDYSSDQGVFKIDHIILGDITSTDTIRDTMTYYQRFYNFYAYDDGTPEASYGLRPAGAKAAMQYTLSRPDTIHGVQMLFNHTVNNANDQYFDLMVWRDNDGLPGEVIYVQPSLKPKYTGGLNQMQYYKFDEIVPVNNVFYIGWIQTENKSLNVGFDRYNNAREYTFTNVIGNWNQSIVEGALMMRPVMSPKEIIGIEDLLNNDIIKPVFYPNPVNGEILNVKFQNQNTTESFRYYIFNVYGQLLQSGESYGQINIAGLNAGVYLVRVALTGSSQIYSHKVIVSK